MSTPLFNAETLLSGKPNLIDLTKLEKAPDIACDKMPDGWYWATDRASFDPDPESRWHIIGRGPTKFEAITELLWRLTEVAQMPEQRYEQIGGITAGVEPPDYRKAPREYVDED